MGKAKKRVNPKITSSVNRNLDELALKEIVKAIKHVGTCWNNRDKRGNPHDPVVVTACCIVKIFSCKTYDSVESYLKTDKVLPELLKKYTGKRKLPGHSVIDRGMEKLTQTYIKKLNKRITILMKRKGMIILVDSTGFSLSTSSKYFDNKKMLFAHATNFNSWKAKAFLGSEKPKTPWVFNPRFFR